MGRFHTWLGDLGQVMRSTRSLSVTYEDAARRSGDGRTAAPWHREHTACRC